MNPADHNPDTNPAWRPFVANRIYRCDACGTETQCQTNHTGKVWGERCKGKCRQISNPNTARELVSPFYGPHSYVRVA